MRNKGKESERRSKDTVRKVEEGAEAEMKVRDEGEKKTKKSPCMKQS